jgi:branched-chain amino acid transport system permease protein
MDHVTTLFVTIGFSIILGDGSLAIWGGDPRTVAAPHILEGSVSILGNVVPIYWVALILIGAVVAIVLFIIERHSVIGAIVRAGVDDGEMVSGLGININRLFLIVFGFGSALAGLAGLLGGPIAGAYPGLDLELIPLAFTVVILGGMGSLMGALVGSIIIGIVNNLGIAFFPQLAYFTIFGPVVIILALKPEGLFGRRERIV